MNGDPISAIFGKLNDISGIINELPTIGKRSELREKAYEIAALIDEARKAAMEMEKEIISLKYEYPSDRFKRVKGVKRG